MKRTPIERLVRAHKFGTGVYLRAEEVREIFTPEPNTPCLLYTSPSPRDS